jgi:hypothetical protein
MIDTELISIIASWSDHNFIVWLSGMLGGEGNLHVPARDGSTAQRTGMDFSFASTDRVVIEGIWRRLDMGSTD